MAMNSQRDIKKPPPLNQIHHSKINQRQDSNISSDSYSMMSSPGYNSKTMEAPLLQHAARMTKSKNLHGQNNSFVMSNFSKSIYRGGEDDSKRQESSISSESISQTSSSSGFNSKPMDTPLLAHALKLQSCESISCFYDGIIFAIVKLDLDLISDLSPQLDKPPFRSSQPDEVIKDSDVNNSSQSAAIIKSSSTPASLQTIVRFSNGSNMSLQHKVSSVEIGIFSYLH